MKVLLVSILAFIGFNAVQTSPAPALDAVAKFKGDCFQDKGKLKPAQNNRWVCFLPNGSLRVSD